MPAEVGEMAWISTQVPKEMKRQIRIKAAKKNMSLSTFVRQLLEELVKAEPER